MLVYRGTAPGYVTPSRGLPAVSRTPGRVSGVFDQRRRRSASVGKSRCFDLVGPGAGGRVEAGFRLEPLRRVVDEFRRMARHGAIDNRGGLESLLVRQGERLSQHRA